MVIYALPFGLRTRPFGHQTRPFDPRERRVRSPNATVRSANAVFGHRTRPFDPLYVCTCMYVCMYVHLQGVSYNHVEMNFFLNGKSLGCPILGIRGTVYPVFFGEHTSTSRPAPPLSPPLHTFLELQAQYASGSGGHGLFDVISIKGCCVNVSLICTMCVWVHVYLCNEDVKTTRLKHYERCTPIRPVQFVRSTLVGNSCGRKSSQILRIGGLCGM